MPTVFITESDESPKKYRIKTDREITTIGRSADSNIIIETPSSSTNHCVIKRVPGGFILEDSGSTNGIKKDETRYQIIDLTDESEAQIGDHVTLKFTLSEEEIAALSEETFESQQCLASPKTATDKTSHAEEAALEDTRNTKSVGGKYLTERTTLIQEGADENGDNSIPDNSEVPQAGDFACHPSDNENKKPFSIISFAFNFILLVLLSAAALILGYLAHEYKQSLLPSETDAVEQTKQ